jgi:hypothetical protein
MKGSVPSSARWILCKRMRRKGVRLATIAEPSSELEPETPSLPSSNEAGSAGKAGKPRARKRARGRNRTKPKSPTERVRQIRHPERKQQPD